MDFSADALNQIVWALMGLLIVVIAFTLRVSVNVGRSPGGVDTWYYLAYADAVRRRPGLDVRLPQYLLQDEKQSYPPVFPSLLALLPQRWLRRWFWTVAPAVDCLHLLLLYWMAFKITDNLMVSALTACLYAFTPQLVSETRSLNGRSLGALLHSLAVLGALRYVMSGEAWPWLALALVFGAALFLSSATSSAAYAFVCGVLSLIDSDPRYLALACGAALLATLVSGGHFVRVIGNYVSALAYWRRNRRRFGAHLVHDSPIYGTRSSPPPAQRPGFLGRNTAHQLLRLLGENPFILALPLAPYGIFPWGPRLYAWAMSLAAFSIAATLLPPLRAFGPGRSYMKAAVLPTAYTLAAGVGSLAGLATPVGRVTLACLGLSMLAIGFFYWYERTRLTEQTASLPKGLASAVEHLAGLPGEAFLCLPTVYADYACYDSGKRVLWGGHCGDLRKLEALAPVITRPLGEMFAEHDVSYVLLETSYARPGDFELEAQLTPLGEWGRFGLYAWRQEQTGGAQRPRLE